MGYIGYIVCMSGVAQKIVSETVPELLALQLAALYADDGDA